MTSTLPGGWTYEDIQFLIEQVKGWPIVMVDDQALGIPAVQDVSADTTEDWGYGISKVTTEKYSVLVQIVPTPSGKGWTHLDVLSGDFPYDKAAVLERLESLLPGTPDCAAGLEQDPALFQEAVEGVEESKEFAEVANTPMPAAQPGDITPRKPPMLTLTMADEGRRLVARGETLVAICSCSIDRSTGEHKYGDWRMYHAGNFLGVLDPESGKQISDPDIRALIKKTSDLYGIQIELAGNTTWILPPKVNLPADVQVGLPAMEVASNE